jgi:phosphatidylethanolamine/phosphatidyl-N-methylethanolamine N-methyltransferase
MERQVIEKVYRRYAKVYDACFGPLFEPGRRLAIEKLDCRPGQRILEVGIGTGLSLPSYPAGVRVAGIDISQEMLQGAQARLRRREVGPEVLLARMDAECMGFADDSFDKVVAMYVASVVPSPVRLVAEMRRVCRPGGELFIVNHFRNTHPVIGRVERLLAPLSGMVGFHPDFCLDQFARDTGLEIDEQVPVNAFGYWTLLRAHNRKPVDECATCGACAVSMAGLSG